MLTSRYNIIRPVARIVHLSTASNVPFCGEIDYLKKTEPQKTNYYLKIFGKNSNACYRYGNNGKRDDNKMLMKINGFIIALPRQNFKIIADTMRDVRRCSSSSLSKMTRNFHSSGPDSTNFNKNFDSDKNAKMRLIMTRLYRILQRLCGSLVPTSQGKILLQNDINASDWGNYQIHVNGKSDDIAAENQTEDLLRFFFVLSGRDPISGISKHSNLYNSLIGSDSNTADTIKHSRARWTTPAALREAVRFAFRSSSLLSSQNPSDFQALAVHAIQMMQDQVKLWNQSSVSNTPNGLVRVTATSRCLGVVSTMSIAPINSQHNPKYRFAYRIRVENISSSETVQLLGRYWHISELHKEDANLKTLPEPIEVDAPYTGAVGQLPVLQPGQVFEYVSGTDLNTPIGEIKGHLYMAMVPTKTRSAKSGDDVMAITCQGSKGSSLTAIGTDDDTYEQTKLFQASVKPFRLESFEK